MRNLFVNRFEIKNVSEYEPNGFSVTEYEDNSYETAESKILTHSMMQMSSDCFGHHSTKEVLDNFPILTNVVSGFQLGTR